MMTGGWLLLCLGVVSSHKGGSSEQRLRFGILHPANKPRCYCFDSDESQGYLLLAMISGLVIPTIKRTLLSSTSNKAANNQIASSLLTSLFLALAIADWIHILLTLHYLPPVLDPLDTIAWISKLTTLAAHPTSWNGLLFGNVVVTFGLFCVRSAWFLGIGRRVNGSTTTAVGKSKKGQ